MVEQKILILLAGNAGAGKDSLGRCLKRTLTGSSSTRLDSFAFTLKSFAHQSMGTPWSSLNGDKDMKEKETLQCAGEDTGITIRSGLQKIGEWFRQIFSPKIWANGLWIRVLDSEEQITIVTDCRYPREEIDWLREVAKDHARLVCVRVRNSRVPVIHGHPSEDVIANEPDSTFDFIVENEGSLSDLQLQADSIVEDLGLVEGDCTTIALDLIADSQGKESL